MAGEAFWTHAHEEVEIAIVYETAATVLTWARGTGIKVLTVGSKVVPNAGAVVGRALGDARNINARAIVEAGRERESSTASWKWASGSGWLRINDETVGDKILKWCVEMYDSHSNLVNIAEIYLVAKLTIQYSLLERLFRT